MEHQGHKHKNKIPAYSGLRGVVGRTENTAAELQKPRHAGRGIAANLIHGKPPLS